MPARRSRLHLDTHGSDNDHKVIDIPSFSGEPDSDDEEADSDTANNVQDHLRIEVPGPNASKDELRRVGVVFSCCFSYD